MCGYEVKAYDVIKGQIRFDTTDLDMFYFSVCRTARVGHFWSKEDFILIGITI